jgi:hypothetical protein
VPGDDRLRLDFRVRNQQVRGSNPLVGGLHHRYARESTRAA